MKYSYYSKGLSVVLLLLLIIVRCKKENLATNFTGTYTGVATERSLPDINTVTTYANCKIVISEIDRKKIRLTITRDPAGSASPEIFEAPVQNVSEFYYSVGGRRQPTTSYKGSVQSRQLVFSKETIWYSGTEYEFKFQGLRD
jgi:hypothetical protein